MSVDINSLISPTVRQRVKTTLGPKGARILDLYELGFRYFETGDGTQSLWDASMEALQGLYATLPDSRDEVKATRTPILTWSKRIDTGDASISVFNNFADTVGQLVVLAARAAGLTVQTTRIKGKFMVFRPASTERIPDALVRAARFNEGPEGSAEWNAWFEDQPADFQEEWTENTDEYGDQFKEGRFEEGPEGSAAWEGWFEDQPEDFQEEWTENTEEYGDQFREARFREGPEGSADWKAWFAEQPQEWQDEWVANTEEYGDKFKTASVINAQVASKVYKQLNDAGMGFAPECESDDVNECEGLGRLVRNSTSDDGIAVYVKGDHTTLVGNANGPWAVTISSKAPKVAGLRKIHRAWQDFVYQTESALERKHKFHVRDLRYSVRTYERIMGVISLTGFLSDRYPEYPQIEYGSDQRFEYLIEGENRGSKQVYEITVWPIFHDSRRPKYHKETLTLRGLSGGPGKIADTIADLVKKALAEAGMA